MVESGIVSVDVISRHSQIEKLLIGLLLLRCVSKGSAESGLKFGPKDLVCLCNISGGEEFSFQLVLLFFCPIINLWSSNERDGQDDSSVRNRC